MILDVGISSHDDSITGVNTGPVEITSPEQFVPLYLAKYIPGVGPPMDDRQRRRAHEFNGIQIPFTANEQSEWRRFRNESSWLNLKRKFVTQVLQNLLVVPQPTRYSFHPMNTRNISYSVAPTINYSFFGRSHGTLMDMGSMGGNRIFAGFGVVGTYTMRNLQDVRSGLYQIHDYGPMPFVYQQSLDVDVMMLIKAKHVNRLRAATLLQRPWDVPFSDLKLLRTTRNLPMSHHATTIIRDLQAYMMRHDMTMDMVDKEEMLKYLVTPNEFKTKVQYLADALQAKSMPSFNHFVQ